MLHSFKRLALKFALCIAVLAAYVTEASAQYYTLTISEEPYVELTNAFMLTTPDEVGDFYLPSITDFSFSGFGVPLGFDAESTGGQGTLISKEGYIAANMIPGNDSIISFHGFLSNHFVRRDNTSSISVSQEGMPGEQILKVQWKNLGFKNNKDADHVNFQIWLHELDNSVSYHYGPSVISSNAAFGGASGPVVGMSQANWPAFTTFSKSDYLVGYATEPTFAHPPYLTKALRSVPAPGVVYTFRPTGAASVIEAGSAKNIKAQESILADRLELTLPQAGMHTLVLMDIAGREVGTTTGSSKLSVSTRGLPRGVYFYRVIGSGLEVVTQGPVLVP